LRPLAGARRADPRRRRGGERVSRRVRGRRRRRRHRRRAAPARHRAQGAGPRRRHRGDRQARPGVAAARSAPGTSLPGTHDFPPKAGGIQSYLYELWRRLPPAETHVLTTPYPGAPAWDGAQAFSVERVRRRVLLPAPDLVRRVDALARERGADVIFLDPMLPLGLVGPQLRAAPYVVIA